MQSRFAFLPSRAVLALEGPDTIALLERLITSNTADWSPGEARFGALLTPQGKVIVDFLGIRTGDGVLLDVHKDAVDDLTKRLKMFRLRSDVNIEPVDGALVVAGIDPADHGVRPVSGAELVYIDPRYPGGRLRAIASETEWRQYHGHEAEWSVPIGEHDADRIASFVPEWGRDYRSAQVFPADVNMDRLGGVDYKKGCFVGQEVVSRMYRRGSIRKRTVTLRHARPDVEAQILSEQGQVIGAVTSTHGDLSLALLRIDRLVQTTIDAEIEGPDWIDEEWARDKTHD